MNYDPDDFLALIEEVDAQGGSHLNETCKPQAFRLNYPIDDERPQGPKANTRFYTTGCHRHAKFLVPLLPDAYFQQVDPLNGAYVGEIQGRGPDAEIVYRPLTEADFDFQDADHPQAKMRDGTPAVAKVCAVDDAMGLWPRFQDAMHTGNSFQEP